MNASGMAQQDHASIPGDGMVITHDVRLQPGSYQLPTGLSISASNITLDGQGAVLIGRDRTGRGLTIQDCSHVTIKNLRLRDYYHGIYVRNCQHLTLLNCHVTGTAEVPPNGDFLDIWRPADNAYGGGIFLWQVSHCQIHHNDLQHQMNGLLTYDCSYLDVQHNLANYCSGFGFHLFNTSHSTFGHNHADFCCRYHARGERRGHMGADAAGFLIVHGSSYNTFRRNHARLGGDGFFLAGLTPAGQHVPCNHNVFEENDGSYSPNIAFEATFSAHNTYRHNVANYCNYGFWLGFSRDNRLENNQICGNRKAGIAVENGIHMTVQNNDLQHNGHGILLWSKYVPEFARAVPDNDTSRDWLIRDNYIVHNDKGIRIAANQDHGIRPFSSGANAIPLPRDHIIQSNQIRQNRVGIELCEAVSTTITQNMMQDNVVGDTLEM